MASRVFEFRVRGEFAWFTRPEMKLDRVRYEVKTPFGRKSLGRGWCGLGSIGRALNIGAAKPPARKTPGRRSHGQEIDPRCSNLVERTEREIRIERAKGWCRR
jgi:hypothetical protein